MADRPLFGQILPNATPANIRVIDAGDALLAEERGRLFQGWVGESRELRSYLRSAEQELAQRVRRARTAPTGLLRSEGGFVRDGSRLTAAGRRSMNAAVTREMRRAFEEMDGLIEDRIRRAVRRSQRVQLRHLERLGLSPPSRAMQQRIEAMTLDFLDREFPAGSGMTYRRRLQRIHDLRRQQVLGVVNRTYAPGKGPDAMTRDLGRSLTFNQPGTPIQGGSAFKQMRRLMVAEETRLANATELATLRASGVSLAYWRLSPAHKWYGGKEICEVLASQEDPAVRSLFITLGISQRGIDFDGLYLMSNFPSYPHPFCKCSPEAYVLPNQQAVVDRQKKEVEDKRPETRREERRIRRLQSAIDLFEPASDATILLLLLGLFGLIAEQSELIGVDSGTESE